MFQNFYTRMRGHSGLYSAPDDGGGSGGGTGGQTGGEGGGGAAAATGTTPAATTTPAGGQQGGLSNGQVHISASAGSLPTDQQTGDKTAAAPEGEWRKGITNADLQKDPTLGNIKTLDDAGKMIVESQRRIGELTTQLKGEAPKADAPAEEWAKFNQRFIPDEKAYEALHTQPKDWPEGVPFDAENAKGWATEARRLGIQPQVFQQMQAKFVKEQTDAIKAATEQRHADGQKLQDTYKKEWGPDTDKRLDAGAKLMNSLLKPEQVAMMGSLNGDARFILGIFADAVNQKYNTNDAINSVNTGGTTPQTAGDTEAGIRAEMQKLQADPSYFNGQINATRTAEIKQQMEALRGRLTRLQGGGR